MNKWHFLKITEVPDLTLTKYNSGGVKGIDSILEYHQIFLRQWHRKGVLSNASIHLFYEYVPEQELGERLNIYIGILGDETALSNIDSLLASSALLSVYQVKALSEQEISVLCKRSEYGKCCMLTKKEVIIKNRAIEDTYYTVADWEPNQDGRLRQLYSLLKALNEKILIRIDLYPEDWHDRIRDTLLKQIEVIQERNKKNIDNSLSRSQAADVAVRSYENCIKQLDNSPLFRTNIFAFGPRFQTDNHLMNDSIELSLDVMASESIEKGDYQIIQIDFPDNKFLNALAFLDGDMESRAFDTTDRSEKVFRKCRNSLGYELMSSGYETKVMRFLPTVFSLEQIAPLFRLPILEESDNSEIRKETDPKQTGNSQSLYLGKDMRGHSVYFPCGLLTKHAFIAGVPGSGKTNLMHHLVSSMWLNKEDRIPFLVFEPAKKEYRALLNQKGMEDIYLFSPNAAMTFPIHINPFEFPKGLMLSEHIRQLEEVFEGAFPLENPMPFLLDTAIEAIYRECGWYPNMVNTEETTLPFPTMSMLYKRLEEELEKTTYSEEVSGNLKSALQVRIGSLLRREMGEIFDVSLSTFSPEEWIRKAAIIELESMGSGPANFMTLLLCALIRETLKVHPHYDKNYARHVIFIEEAHNLIGPTATEKSGNDADPKQAATAFVVKMLAEVRALKEGIVIADQLPTVMAPEIIKNTGLKIGLRITSADDRELLCSTMSANSMQMEAMSVFEVGHALISYEGLRKPYELQTHQWLGPGNGAYVEDDLEREVVETAKSDSELQSMIVGRKWYEEIAEKSFCVEMHKFKKRVDDYLDETDKYTDFFVELNGMVQRREKIEEQLVSGIDILNKNMGLTIDNIKEDVDRFNILLEEQQRSEYYKNAFYQIKKGLIIIRDIGLRKDHWYSIGFQNWEKKDLYKSGIEKIYTLIMTEIKYLYLESKKHMEQEQIIVIDSMLAKMQRFIIQEGE